MLTFGSIMAFATSLGSCTGWEEVDFQQWEGVAHVHADVIVKKCPDIRFYTVAPLQTSVGGTLALHASATWADGGTVTIRWSGTGGDVENPNAAETKYVCREAGHQMIKVTAFGLACEQSQRIDVVCVPPRTDSEAP